MPTSLLILKWNDCTRDPNAPHAMVTWKHDQAGFAPIQFKETMITHLDLPSRCSPWSPWSPTYSCKEGDHKAKYGPVVQN